MKNSHTSDSERETISKVGLETGPDYSTDPSAWAECQAAALRSRQVDRLDWDNLAEEVLDVARGERRELGYRVAALMASLARQALFHIAPKPPNLRLVREHRKLVAMQLATCPSHRKMAFRSDVALSMLVKCCRVVGWHGPSS
ncbi:DUF29 family protein [Thauera sp. ZXT1-4]|uniref:DUF29 family protein n=1 Tax=Thauera sp. ZXT1-4 TaxID=3460294 RepID=UPI004040A010